MAKRVNSVGFTKALLSIDWNINSGIITEFVKEGKDIVEYEYDLFAILEEFNGKTITIAISEQDSLAPIDDFNVSSETDGTEEEDNFKED